MLGHSMAHVTLPNGSSLRLRLFPKPKAAARAKHKLPASLSLFEAPSAEELLDTNAERMAAKVASLCVLNRNNAAILDRFDQLGIRDWWLGSGCLFQTVWNLKSGRPAERGIVDYDVFYFSEDATWEAEDDVIKAAEKLFADLSVPVQVRNQARVHLWFPEKYGVAYPPLTTAAEGILRFTSGAQCIGLKRTGEDYLDLYAPYGLTDVWEMIARPNRAMQLSKVFAEKTERWKKEWPQLTVFPWTDENDKSRAKAL